MCNEGASETSSFDHFDDIMIVITNTNPLVIFSICPGTVVVFLEVPHGNLTNRHAVFTGPVTRTYTFPPMMLCPSEWGFITDKCLNSRYQPDNYGAVYLVYGCSTQPKQHY